MTSKEVLVYAFIKFLADDANSPETSEEMKESIEVAKQCLETAYKLEHGARPDLDLKNSLEELISNAKLKKVLTQDMKEQAERFKKEGNDLVNAEKYIEAIESYSRAIGIDNTNAVYFSNRAAAYNKLNDYRQAVDDCEEAIAIDPNYSKAYGRKGLALSGLGMHAEAIESYRKAIELDPTNQNFRVNLEIAEEKARESAANPMAGGLGSLLGGAGGMPDLGQILNNPTMMQFASQMMSDPNMQQMMSNMMNVVQPNAQPPSSDGTQPAPSVPGVDQFMRVGQQMAEQMQRENPDLINQLRNRFQGNNENGSSGNNPDSTS